MSINYYENHRTADYAVERRFVISRLTEAQLNEFEAQARAEYQAERAKAIADNARDAELRNRTRVHCGEAGFREKNPDVCWVGLGESMPFIPDILTVEQRYEEKIMGICLFIQTVGEARRAGCLPRN